MVKRRCFDSKLAVLVLKMLSAEVVDNVNWHVQVVEPVEHVELEDLGCAGVVGFCTC